MQTGCDDTRLSGNHFGKYRNEDSFLALLGEDSDEEEREYLSVEKHVTEEMPPCFFVAYS